MARRSVSGSASRIDSVTSISSTLLGCRSGSSLIARSTSVGQARVRFRCVDARLTAIGSAGRPAACQAAFWRQAVSMAHSPIGMTSPLSSISGMNSPGSDHAALGVDASGPAPRRRRCAPLATSSTRLVVQHELVALERAAAASDSIVNRSSARAFMLNGRRTGSCRGPASLARYIAVSAFISRVSASAPSSGYIATPTLQPTKISLPRMITGSASAATRRRATLAASARAHQVVQQHDELVATQARDVDRAAFELRLPGCRVTESWCAQRTASGAALTARSSSSPALCPSVSLTRLKLSRSTNMIAICALLPMRVLRWPCATAR